VTFTADELTRIDANCQSLTHVRESACHDVRFAFDRAIVSVRFADLEAANMHRSRYRHMLATGEPALTLYVAARGAATHFWIPAVAAYRWDRYVLAPHAISFLADAVATTHAFESLPDTIVLHAAAVAGPSGVAALVGTTEAGKTTTSLACARLGLALLSDEFCVRTPRGVIPFPRTLNIRRGGIELLAEGAEPGLPLNDWIITNGGADRHDVGFDELFGDWQRPGPGPLRAVFLVAGRDAVAQAKVATPAGLLPRILPWSRMKARGVDAASELLELLQGVACFELVLGTPEETARLVARALSESRASLL
jgi:hypothetical protein